MRYANKNGLNLHKMRGFMDCHARVFTLARNDGKKGKFWCEIYEFLCEF